ncbi:MAG: DUF924 family protein [Pseudomonadota bacterium]
MTVSADDVLKFWLDAGTGKWWTKDDGFDAAIRENFATFWQEASRGDHDQWKDEPHSALALVLTLDQFSRNLNRNSALAFSNDSHCCSIVHHALDHGYDQECDPEIASFFYLPLMHSESIVDQERCVKLMHACGQPGGLEAALEHRDIVSRFGRFPHRNAVLGRHTSEAEQAFLDGGGFKG